MIISREGVREDIIEYRVEPSAAHFGGIEGLEGTGGGISGIGKEGLIIDLALAVKAVKGGPWEKNLTPDFKLIRRAAIRVERQGDGRNGLDIIGHDIATGAITTGDGTDQTSMFIDEGDGGSVILHFAANGHLLRGEELAHGIDPRVHFLN